MTDMAKRGKYLLEKYGITEKQWNKLFNLQGGVCPICLKPLLKPGNKEGKRAAAVDHDHRTGKVRGLLDFRCNFRVVRRMSAAQALRVSNYLNSDLDGRNL